MKITVTEQVEKEVIFLKVNARVRYWEDSNVNDVSDEEGDLMPFREGDSWCPIIEVDTGKIVDWPIGTTAEVHYKICDDGSYYLCDQGGSPFKSIEDDYVPDCLCPNGGGYGDYIILSIDENGIIGDWKPKFDDFN